MKIGSKAPALTQAPVSRFQQEGGSVLGAAFGAVAQAAGSIGMNKMELELMLRERDRKQRRAVADVEFAQLVGEQDRAIIEAQQGMQPGGQGFANGIASGLRPSFEEFAKRTGIADDPELMAEYEPRYEAFAQDHITRAFSIETDESNRYVADTLMKGVSQGQEAIQADPTVFDAQYAGIVETIDKSDLPPLQKEELKEQAYTALAGALFSKETEMAVADQRPVRPPTGGDVVAPGLSPGGRAFLNAISGPESGNSYTRRYNGGDGSPDHITDFSDHPRLYSLTERGDWSSAAGRYQITASTWDETVREMNGLGYNITDFSPVNQDRVAWYLAEKRYGELTGGVDLQGALESGDPAAIAAARKILTPTWQGLKHLTDDEFVQLITRGTAEGGTGHSVVPDVWSDPRFADLTYDQKYQAYQGGKEVMLALEKGRAEAAEAADKARTDALLLSIRDGDKGAVANALRAVEQGEISAIENVNRIDAATKEARENEAVATEVATIRLSDGVIGDDAKLDIYSRHTGITKGVENMEPAAAKLASDLSVEQGRIPASVSSALTSMINSNDPRAQSYAASMLVDISNASGGRALAGQSQDVVEKANLLDILYRYNSTPEAAIAEYNRIRSPEGQLVRDRNRKAFEESIEEMGVGDFFGQAAGTWETWAPEFLTGMPATQGPGSPAMSDRFMSQYLAVYKEQYAVFGDGTKAHEATTKLLRQRWSPSPISGHLMEMSPSAPGMGVSPINGDFSWIERDVRLQMGVPEDPISLVSDMQTMQDLQMNGAPTYQVVTVKDGLYHYLPGRVTIRVTPEVERREIEEEIERQAAVADAPILPDITLPSISPEVRSTLEDAGTAVINAITPPEFGTTKPEPNPRLEAESARARAAAGLQKGLARNEERNAKQKREAALREIMRANPSMTRKDAEFRLDVMTLSKEKGITPAEASKILRGVK
jgi:muramidase (phage lysozyme)